MVRYNCKSNLSLPAFVDKGEKILLGQKDITEKILADYNDVFADIVNTLTESSVSNRRH